MAVKHITILGGSGFVGRALVARLSDQGHHIKVITRYRENTRNLLVLPQVTLVQGDIHDRVTLAQELAGSDLVINLVAILNESGRSGKGFEKVHVHLVEKIVQTCAALNIDRLIHMSALKASADDAPSHYLKTKGRGENAIKRNNGSALNWTILQPSVMFGPDDSFVNKFAKLIKLPMPFLPLPRANARFAPVYVQDVVSAIVQCVNDDQTSGKTFQLCGPQVFSLREIVQLIANELGVNRKIVAMPDTLAKAQAFIMDYTVPGKPFSIDNFKSLTVHSICDSDGLTRLGVQATSMDAILPTFLGNALVKNRYSQMREHAGRSHQ